MGRSSDQQIHYSGAWLTTCLHHLGCEKAIAFGDYLIDWQRVKPALHCAQPTKPSRPCVVIGGQQYTEMQFREADGADRQFTRQRRYVIGDQNTGV
jgi:hypothetical protein